MGVIRRVAVAVCAVVAGVGTIAGCADGTGRDSAAPVSSTPAAIATPAATPTPSPSEVDPTTTASPKPAKSSAKPKPTGAPTVDAGGNDVIGPFGWQTLRLGMSSAEAEALGMLFPATEGDGELCAVWDARPITALDRAIVHPKQGVFAIHPKQVDWIHTPEGMHVGWTVAQVAATYPDFDPAKWDYAHGPTVQVPGNPNALYRLGFTPSKVLDRIILESRVDVCSV